MSTASDEPTGRHVAETEGGRRFCPATTKAGRVCGSPSLKADPAGFCWTHSPTIAAKRQESQRRGGSTTTQRRALLLGRVDFHDSVTILAFRQALTSAVLTGQVQAARAGVAATIAQQAEAAFVGQALEARLSALETALQALVERRSRLVGSDIA